MWHAFSVETETFFFVTFWIIFYGKELWERGHEVLIIIPRILKVWTWFNTLFTCDVNLYNNYKNLKIYSIFNFCKYYDNRIFCMSELSKISPFLPTVGHLPLEFSSTPSYFLSIFFENLKRYKLITDTRDPVDLGLDFAGCPGWTRINWDGQCSL